MITIEGSESIAAIENHLRILKEGPRVCDLKLPTKLRAEKFGGKAALIQLILTWSHRSTQSGLITHIQSASQAMVQLENLAGEEHGLIALLARSSAKTVRGHLIDAETYARATKEYYEIYRQPRLKGLRAFFLIADHLTDATADCFYDHLISILDLRAERKQSFIKELNNRIEICISRSGGSRLTSDQKKSLGEIVYELFNNTERWGQPEAKPEEIVPSLRGILVQVHSDPKRHLSAATGSPPMEKYLENIIPELGAKPGLLEISIFDSGIGLARRIRGVASLNKLSLLEERDATLECLVLRGTSSTDETEGVGLYHVLKLLSQSGGFLRYRGGRLSLFRDFKEHMYLPEKYTSREARRTQRTTRTDSAFRKKSTFLLDWQSMSLDPTEMPETEGTMFTLLLPLAAQAAPAEQLELVPAPKE